LLVAFLLFAYAAIVYLTDPSFYRFGHFRADSVPELAAGEPKFRGPEYCSNCHIDRHAEWSQGTHAKVKCEVCHGPAADHPATGKLPIPDDPVKLCTTCHEAMPARPDSQPQIVLAEHPFPSDTPVVCINCHNPHSPRIGDPGAVVQPVQAAEEIKPTGTVGTPLSAKSCAACHGALGEGVGVFPPLAGMLVPQFIERMMQFKTGEVPSPMMGAIANGLSDSEIRELAKYYAALHSGAE
jgi:cytochrome c553